MKSNGKERPEKIQAIGHNEYYINYNIVENEDGYEWGYVKVMGYPTYNSVVTAMIRDRYSDDEVEAIVNNYESYKLGISSVTKYVSEYEDFLRFRINTKEIVREIFNISR